jgi:hypothetical protein
MLNRRTTVFLFLTATVAASVAVVVSAFPGTERGEWRYYS